MVTVADCPGYENTWKSGIIQSPNYPDPYPRNALCKWMIEVEAGKQIDLIIKGEYVEQMKCCILFIRKNIKKYIFIFVLTVESFTY